MNRDNYNSLTSAKLPPTHKDGQLKSICVDKNTDIINILIEKLYVALELWQWWRWWLLYIQELQQKVSEGIWKGLWNNNLVTLYGWEDARTLHSKLYYLIAKNMKTGFVEWSTFYVLGLLGQLIKKLAMSWIIPSLALLLHIVLSIIACSYIYDQI